MQQEKRLSFVFSHSNPTTASKEQQAYLNSGNYSIPIQGGKEFKRIRELMALNPVSGNILVKEKTLHGDYNFEKLVVISRDGRPEKFRGENF